MTNSLIRPAWTPVTIGMMIIGFMIKWPLGVAMIAYIIWGDRLELFKQDVNNATDKIADVFKPRSSKRSATGNAAFDEWREVELARIEEERKRLDETRSEFDAYQRDLRRAKDKDEFDEFLKFRKRKKPAPRSKKSGNDTIET